MRWRPRRPYDDGTRRLVLAPGSLAEIVIVPGLCIAFGGSVAAPVGDRDEAFRPEALQPTFRAAGRDPPVQVLPGLGHIPLALDPVALQAIVQRVGLLQQAR